MPVRKARQGLDVQGTEGTLGCWGGSGTTGLLRESCSGSAMAGFFLSNGGVLCWVPREQVSHPQVCKGRRIPAADSRPGQVSHLPPGAGGAGVKTPW